jgi:hypothetical protein
MNVSLLRYWQKYIKLPEGFYLEVIEDEKAGKTFLSVRFYSTEVGSVVLGVDPGSKTVSDINAVVANFRKSSP